jgi:SP family general alpha glucoside:H+ symporter-like MFS transporter
MTATVNEERMLAERNAEEGAWAVFQGRNRIRFIIAAWPKIAQQLVGLAVFNTYATYFCEQPLYYVTLLLSNFNPSPIRG